MNIVMVTSKEKNLNKYIYICTLIAQLVQNSPDAGDTSSIPGLRKIPGEGIGTLRNAVFWASPGGSDAKASALQ